MDFKDVKVGHIYQITEKHSIANNWGRLVRVISLSPILNEIIAVPVDGHPLVNAFGRPTDRFCFMLRSLEPAPSKNMIIRGAV